MWVSLWWCETEFNRSVAEFHFAPYSKELTCVRGPQNRTAPALSPPSLMQSPPTLRTLLVFSLLGRKIRSFGLTSTRNAPVQHRSAEFVCTLNALFVSWTTFVCVVREWIRCSSFAISHRRAVDQRSSMLYLICDSISSSCFYWSQRTLPLLRVSSRRNRESLRVLVGLTTLNDQRVVVAKIYTWKLFRDGAQQMPSWITWLLRKLRIYTFWQHDVLQLLPKYYIEPCCCPSEQCSRI